MTENEYTLSSLPEEVKNIILKQRVVKNNKEYYENKFYQGSRKESSIFDLIGDEEETPKRNVNYREIDVIWESPVMENKEDEETISEKDLSLILPRHKKSKEEQKKRVKSKAEVFTPTWVVNKQNNLIDDTVIQENFFNSEAEDGKTWIPTESPLVFPEHYDWAKYVTDRRLEMCCGEAPYLVSRYDAASGTDIDVKDEKGRFQRVGLLDRKLRVVSEMAETASEWHTGATAALKTTFGFEWQGDNLLLARLNFINTFFDYQKDFYETKGIKTPTKKKHEETLLEVAEITSWQLWQMDGLKMVIPDSCSDDCDSCKKKLYSGHDGLLSVVKWCERVKAFNDFLPENSKSGKK